MKPSNAKKQRLAPPDEQRGIDWWNDLSEPARARWMGIAGSAIPADAWAAFKKDLADGILGQLPGFPASIIAFLNEVADRKGTDTRGPWEDELGNPLQDDADAALLWIAVRAQAPAAAAEVVARWIEDSCPNLALDTNRKLMAATVRALAPVSRSSSSLE
jgi:hypothetical protein